MLGIDAPTASLLLSDFVDLKSGDWVVQNAANSGVGRWEIALAKVRGLRTVNIVRRPELVDELKALGGDVVVDSPDVAGRIRAAVGQDDLHLALDGVSGPATGVRGSILSPGGTLVSFAAMSEAPISMSPLDVIFKPITLWGFFMGHPEYAAKIPPALEQAAAMIASGLVHVPVSAIYPLSSIKEVVAHALRRGNGRHGQARVRTWASGLIVSRRRRCKVRSRNRAIDPRAGCKATAAPPESPGSFFLQPPDVSRYSLVRPGDRTTPHEGGPHAIISRRSLHHRNRQTDRNLPLPPCGAAPYEVRALPRAFWPAAVNDL
jgi:hypothetical protein